MRKKTTISVIAASVGVATISVLTVNGSWAESGGTPVDPELRLLEQTQTPSDKLPAIVANSEHLQELEAGSSRVLKSTDENDYWVVRNDKKEICLVAYTPDDVAGTTCADPGAFNARGLAVQVISENYGTEAYVVPDAAMGVSNLVTVSPFDKNKEATVASELGRENVQRAQFSIRTLPEPQHVPLGLQQKLGED